MSVVELTSCPVCEVKFAAKSKKHKYCSKDCREKSKQPAEPEKLEFTLTDLSNHLLAFGPSAMSCGIMRTGDGPQLILTIRTSSATLTVGLDRANAVAWFTELAKKIQEMQQIEADAKAVPQD